MTRAAQMVDTPRQSNHHAANRQTSERAAGGRLFSAGAPQVDREDA